MTMVRPGRDDPARLGALALIRRRADGVYFAVKVAKVPMTGWVRRVRLADGREIGFKQWNYIVVDNDGAVADVDAALSVLPSGGYVSLAAAQADIQAYLDERRAGA